MATIRVHADQENRVADVRRAKEKVSLPVSSQILQQNKRAVLGVLHNNCSRNSKPVTIDIRQNCQQEICKDEKYSKAKAFVPTQYETYKVYEDRKDEVAPFKIYEDKLEAETSVVLRETRDSREVKVKQSVEVTIKAEREKPLLEVNPTVNKEAAQEIRTEEQSRNLFDLAPLSLEKSLGLSDTKKDEAKAKREASKALRVNFFDVDEYRADIYNYLRLAEVHHRPKPGYMKKQPDITYPMRSILVDWLVEVAEEYRLHTETLYLAVSYIDRFLSYMSVVRAKLQLLGTAAMFIAAKYEEIYPPDVGEFVYITDDTYTKKQVLRMEHLILRVLSFDLTVPTPLAFLMYYCVSNNLSEKIQYLAMYLCELSLLEADPYLQFVPSTLAASAIALARHTLQEEVWPHELELSSGYSLQDLKVCISCLGKTFCNANNIKQQAIQEKYKSSKYGHVSLLLPRSTDALACEDDGESA